MAVSPYTRERDWGDDRRENLRLLCPNCHAVTSTRCRGGRHRR